jgi:hypothetical protein
MVSAETGFRPWKQASDGQIEPLTNQLLRARLPMIPARRPSFSQAPNAIPVAAVIAFQRRRSSEIRESLLLYQEPKGVVGTLS